MLLIIDKASKRLELGEPPIIISDEEPQARGRLLVPVESLNASSDDLSISYRLLLDPLARDVFLAVLVKRTDSDFKAERRECGTVNERGSEILLMQESVGRDKEKKHGVKSQDAGS